MDDETLQMSMLYDFFGDLLTERQREYFDLYHNEDLSLSEIAEKACISRQGVYDIITRAEKTLQNLELKTGVVRKWRETNAQLEEAEALARELHRLSAGKGKSAGLAGRLVEIMEGISRE